MNFIKKFFDKKNPPKTHEPVNRYEQLRTMVFNLNSKQLKTDIEIDDEAIFGVIFEQDFDGTAATLICLITGDASLYFESGAIVRGGINNPAISQSAIDLVKEARKLNFPIIKEARLPEKDNFALYFLTNKNITGTGLRDLNNADPVEIVKLFAKSHDVITEMRKSAPLN